MRERLIATSVLLLLMMYSLAYRISLTLSQRVLPLCYPWFSLAFGELQNMNLMITCWTPRHCSLDGWLDGPNEPPVNQICNPSIQPNQDTCADVGARGTLRGRGTHSCLWSTLWEKCRMMMMIMEEERSKWNMGLVFSLKNMRGSSPRAPILLYNQSLSLFITTRGPPKHPISLSCRIFQLSEREWQQRYNVIQWLTYVHVCVCVSRSHTSQLRL